MIMFVTSNDPKGFTGYWLVVTILCYEWWMYAWLELVELFLKTEVSGQLFSSRNKLVDFKYNMQIMQNLAVSKHILYWGFDPNCSQYRFPKTLNSQHLPKQNCITSISWSVHQFCSRQVQNFSKDFLLENWLLGIYGRYFLQTLTQLSYID